MSVRKINLFIVILLIFCSGAFAAGPPTQQPIRIKGAITASAPSQTYGSVQNLVNGSQLDIETLQHGYDQNGTGMWVTNAGGVGSSENHPFGLDCSTWVKFDFDRSYSLGLMLLWNHNQWSTAMNLTDRGLRNVSIHYTNDGSSWTHKGDYEIPQCPGGDVIDTTLELDFAGVDANSVVITAAATAGNWGSLYYGMSEVMFGIDGTTYDPYSNHPAEASVLSSDITASASSEYDGYVPASNTITGNLLAQNFRHGNDGGFWHGDGSTTPTSAVPNNTATGAAWLRYDFAQPQELGTMWIWNMNQIGGDGSNLTTRGLKKVYIDYLDDTGTWHRLMDTSTVPEPNHFILNQASGESLIEHTDAIDFGGVTATSVVITADQNDGMWGDPATDPYYGLSEVLFGIANTVWSAPGDPEVVLPAEDAVHDTRIVASASSSWGGPHPQKTVNGSGLNWDTLLHDNDSGAETMWHADGNTDLDSAHPNTTVGYEWIKYDFDKSYPIGTMWVWNMNQIGGGGSDLTGRGLKKVYIEYTNDGENWSKLMDGENDFFILDKASGEAQIQYTSAIDFAGVDANSVVITADATDGDWGGAPYVGLSEVRFGIFGTTYRGHPEVVDGDIDDDFDVDIDDLGGLAIGWLENNIIAPADGNEVEDFEIYTVAADPNLADKWTIVANPGSLSLLPNPDDVHGGNQAMRLISSEAVNPDYTKISRALAAPIDLDQLDVLRLWIKRHENNDYHLIVRMFDDQQTELISGWLLLSTGSTYYPIGEWAVVDLDLRGLTAPAIASSMQIEFGAAYVAAVGTLDIDDIELINLPGCSAYPEVDITGDCKVDMSDFAVLADNWLKGTAL